MATEKLIGDTLHNVERCPQCGVSNPLLTTVNKPSLHHRNGSVAWYYVTMRCSKCRDQVLYYGVASSSDTDAAGIPNVLSIATSFPSLRSAAGDIPDRARSFLQQALDSLHAPDGAIMLAASSVDSMLKDKGYKENSLFFRINQAHEDGLLTRQMRDWAHEIRLSANEPRHADDDFQGATSEDAKQVIEFAEALGEYLYVLPARVKKWQSIASSNQS